MSKHEYFVYARHLMCAGLISLVAIANHAGAAVVTSVAVESLASREQTAVPLTFGQMFRRGDLPGGSTVVLQTAGGAAIPTQLDVKTRHPDGSLAHAVISARLPSLGASSTAVLMIDSRPTADVAAAEIQLADLLATNFDAITELKIGGVLYSASARDLLTKGKYTQWLSGPVASEWIVGGPVVTAGGQVHSQVAVFFHVRAFGKPVDAVRVDVVFENGVNLVDNATDATYDSTIKISGATVDSRSLTHYPRARWHSVFWWGQSPAAFVGPDVQYLQATKAVPRYMRLSPPEDYLRSLTQEAKPMGTGDLTVYMPATGAQSQIGPLPRWAATYLVSGDRRAYRNLLANDSSGATYRIHYRDPVTGQPVSIVDRPTQQSLQSTSVATDLRIVADNAHHPSIGYASYLVTGDHFYLEELQFWATHAVLSISSLMRERDKGIVIGIQQQIRGQAWILRTLGQAAFITPDADPLKSKLASHIAHNLSRFRFLYMKDPVPADDKYANLLGALRNRDEQGLHEYPPWEDDFFTWSTSQLVDFGFSASDVLSWKARFSVGRMGEPVYESCFVNAAAYKVKVGVTADGPWLKSFKEVYEKNFGPLPANCPDGQAFNSETYPKSPSGYSSGQMRVALVAAVNAGVPGAQRAWQKFSSAIAMSNPDYSDYPNWALIPDAPTKRPKPPGGLVVE